MNNDETIVIQPEQKESSFIINEKTQENITIDHEDTESNVSVNQEIIKVESAGAERYKGEYVFTPLAYQQQKAETKRKYLENDITIKAVPIYEVSNTTEGTTVYIASEVE